METFGLCPNEKFLSGFNACHVSGSLESVVTCTVTGEAKTEDQPSTRMCSLLGEERRKVLVDSGNSLAVFNKTVVKLLFTLGDIFRVTHTHATGLNQAAVSHCREFLLFIGACAAKSLQNGLGCV